MKPIIVGGRILSIDDLNSLKQHIDMMAEAASAAQDAYYHQVMSSVSGVLEHCIRERTN